MAMAMASLVVLRVPPVNSVNLSSLKSETLISPLSLSLSTPSPSLSLSTYPISIYCGRGDKKTARGKRFNHSFGNARPRNKNKGRGPPRVPVPAGPPRKDKFEDDEIIDVELDDSLDTSDF